MVDDELLALELLEKQVEKIEHIDIVGKYTNPADSLELVKKGEVHVAFLDIQMPDIDGLELAERMLEIDPQLSIVFTTAYNEYAVEAFELDAIDYLIKPVKVERLEKTMQRLYKEQKIIQAMEEHEKRKTLRLQMKNYLSFETKDNSFQPIAWRTAKAQELFIYLLENAGSFVEKDLLAEMLWEDKDLESGVSLLYTTVYNIRKALRPYADHFQIQNRTDGYLLELTDVDIDTVTWLESVQAIRCTDDETAEACEKLLDSYDGTYLSQHDYVWLEGKRQYMTKIWLEKANEVIDYYNKQQNQEKVIEILEKTIAVFPTEEDMYFKLMQLYEKAGNIDLVERCYRQLIDTLHSELGVEPNSKISEWFQKNIMKKLSLNDMVEQVSVTEK